MAYQKRTKDQLAARVAQDISGTAPRRHASAAAEESAASSEHADRARGHENQLRALMSRHVGVVRNGDGLATAIGAITRWERAAGSNASRNMAIAALLVATAAWRRRESRGGHYRSDYPQTDRPQRTFVRLSADGGPMISHAGQDEA